MRPRKSSGRTKSIASDSAVNRPSARSNFLTFMPHLGVQGRAVAPVEYRAGGSIFLPLSAQMPGLGLHERADAGDGERGAGAGFLPSGPGQAGTDAVAAIPAAGTGIDGGEDAFGAGAVSGVHARGQAVFGVIHQCDGFGIVIDDLNADDRAEALLAHEQHAMVGIGEYRRLEVEA